MTRSAPPQNPLPYPVLGHAIRIVIEQAIALAWENVRVDLRKSGMRIHKAPEVALNACLVSALNALLDNPSPLVPGFSGSIFQNVVRGGELRNYDGAHLEKRPDLVFRLLQRRPGVLASEHDGLFGECKILDTPELMRRYCKEGVRRFVNGDYAWAMREGLMVGYSRSGVALPGPLMAAIQKHRKLLNLSSSLSFRSPLAKPAIMGATHGRNWKYGDNTSPGEIQVDHLWLIAAPIRTISKKKKRRVGGRL